MKLLFIILLFIGQFAAGQNLRKWSSDSTTNTAWGNWLYRLHPTYAAGTGDTLKFADYKLVKDSAVFNIFRTPGKDSLFFTRGGQTFAIKDSSGTANAWAQGGNSFGALGVFGTNDNNAIDVELNNVVKHRFQVDGTISINTTNDVTQLLYVNGNSRFDGLLNISNNFGLSALSGAAMFNFGANGPTTSVTWALNNTYTNSAATKNYFRIAADVTTNSASTQTINQHWINPTINNTAGTTTLRGYYYDPILTAVTGTTNIAWENSSGFVRFKAVGTPPSTYTIFVHSLQSDSNLYQVPSTTFTTPAQVATQIHDSLGTNTTIVRSPLITYAGAGSDPDTLAILGLNGLGTAGQSIRINAGATGFEYYTPSAGGITSINSETGPAITLTGINGLTRTTTTNNVEYKLGGTLSETTQIDGGSQALNLGQNSSRLLSFHVNSAGLIQLFGLLQLNSENSTDADYTITDRAGAVRLVEITANRVVTVPPQGSGKFLIIWNENSSGNNWSFTVSGGGNVVDAAGTTITTLANDSVYILVSLNGNYVKIN